MRSKPTIRSAPAILLLFITLALAATLIPTGTASANALGIPDSEYAALVALYNSTGGPAWSVNDGWLTTSSNWHGVAISAGHVVQLNLQNNGLTGSIPAELEGLAYLQRLNLKGNRLLGEIPPSLMNLTQLQAGMCSISYNSLWATDPGLLEFLAVRFPEWDRWQTIAPVIGSARGIGSVMVTWTPIQYCFDSGYYEIGVSPTAAGPYTFDSSRRTSSKFQSSITVTGLPADKPQYFVVRAVTLPNANNPLAVTGPASAPILANPMNIPDAEYSALVALYNSTGGDSWLNKGNWMTNTPVWYGVTVSGGHVTTINLPGNLLTGPLPAELGALTSLQTLNLRGNQLSGQIPASIGNLTLLQPSAIGLASNALWNTDPTLGTFMASKFPNWHLTQTIAPTNVSAQGPTSVRVSWTPIAYTTDPGYYEVGVSSTPEGPFVFDSSRRTASKSVDSLWISGLPSDQPQYFVVRTVTSANAYSVVPTTSAQSEYALANSLYIPDSELKALAALYNSTGGPNWTRRDRWMTRMGAWYGVGISGGHVTQLNLPANMLSGSLPPEMGNLTGLVSFNLMGNRLMGEIPASLTNLTQLRTGGSTFHFNGLWTSNPALESFLSAKAPSWQMTQTIPPSNVAASGKGTVNLSWTRIPYTGDGGYYEVGVSSTPGGPYDFYSSMRTSSKSAESIVVTGLNPNAPHFFAIRTFTSSHPANPSPIVTGPSSDATEWTSVKLGSDYTSTALTDGIVTAVFPECFYVESKDRSWGIRATAAGKTVTPGKVTIGGTLCSDPLTRERSITTAKVLQTGAGELTPLAMPIVSVGGANWHYGYSYGQAGVYGGRGLNNIGLLVRICGRITQRDTAVPARWFRLDDGTASVKCVVPAGVTINPAWNYASVTGVSSCERPDGQLVRLLRVRSADDINAF